MIPGEYRLGKGKIVINAGRKTTTVQVTNQGDRPVQVGSHYHFFEVNPALSFDREAAYGMHLDILSGTSVRFEAGEEKEVTLVEFAGARFVQGFHGLVNGSLDDPAIRQRALQEVARLTKKEGEA